MTLLCYRRHRFPPEIIQHAIWLYLRFTLSYRDGGTAGRARARDLLRNGTALGLKFGPSIARRLPIPMVPYLGSVACTESSRLPAACELEFSEGTVAFPSFFLKGKSERGS
jgi:hypothetical protein